MLKYIRILAVFFVNALLVFRPAADAEVYRTWCHEDHAGPPPAVGPDKIGTFSGWAAFSLFVADGGYGVSQAVLDEIADLNAAYQEDYEALMVERGQIKAALSMTHVVGGT